MRNKVELPVIGRVPSGSGGGGPTDTELMKFLRALKEIIEVREGRRGPDYLDRAVTYRDLIDLGLIVESDVPRKP